MLDIPDKTPDIPDEKRQDDEEQLKYLRNLYTKKDTKRAW